MSAWPRQQNRKNHGGLQAAIGQVRRNCEVCDARHAGLFSLCSLAMRLRDLFKWEKGLPPWEERAPAEVLEWIGHKEEAWEEALERDLEPIPLGGRSFDPFDVDELNAELEPRGFLYGAGYVHGLRPTFFLAPVEHKTLVDHFAVYTLGPETARDLLTLPALSQGKAILLRRQASAYFLWDRITFAPKGARRALEMAFRCHGFPANAGEEIRRGFSTLLADQMEITLHHELGALQDDVFDDHTWRAIVAAFPHSPIEVLARAIKDLLADTHPRGTLPHILKQENAASLALYAALLDGMRQAIYPEFHNAFKVFRHSADWKSMERVVAFGRRKTRSLAQLLTELYEDGLERRDSLWAEQQIRLQILEPLTEANKTALNVENFP